MKALFKQAFYSTGLRQSLVMVVGNVLSTGISAVALILISRMLGPTKFGEFSVGFAIVLMVSRLNDAGLSATILKFAASTDDRKQINSVFSTTLRFKLLLTMIIVVVGVLISPLLAKLLNFNHPDILAASFVFGVCTVYYEQLLAMLQALQKFSSSVLINTLQAAVKLASVGVFFFAGISSSLTVFSVYVAAPFVPVLFTKFLVPNWVKIGIQADNAQLTTKIRQMAYHSSVAFISAGVIENVDILFVQRYLNTYETGLLGGVSRIALMFALIAYSLGNVLNSRVSRYQTKEHLATYLKKAGGIVVLTLASFILFLPFAKYFILLTIGQDYMVGLPILIILVAASFLAIASIPFIALFYSFDASWYFSVSGIMQLIIVLVGNAVFVPIYGLEAAAWTRFATRLFLFLFTTLLGIYLYYTKYVRRAT
jgi:O-antigen/teichoic acid export membrane protein